MVGAADRAVETIMRANPDLVEGLHLTATLVGGPDGGRRRIGSVMGSLVAPELAFRLRPGRTYLWGEVIAAAAGLALVLAEGPR